MLTLDSTLLIPPYVTFTVVGQDAFLLNTRTNRYFALQEVGTRLWTLLKDGTPLKEACQSLRAEYEVQPAQLEQDILELVGQLLDNKLVEIA
ncbi:MAG TPA: PqqD family protein [Anaerolineales bacterium]|nr:PqqD family protein [Anaerolineales bacterium]